MGKGKKKMDYAGNAHKDKGDKKRPDKKIEKVVTSDVVIQKKSIGRKFRDIFVEADFRNVSRYIVGDVLIPAIRNLIVDASTKGIERMIYGETAIRRRNFGAGPRVTYNRPIERGYRQESPLSRGLPQPGAPRHNRDEFILTSREDAENVIEQMQNILEQYEVVSVQDLNELVGLPGSYIDNKWGWISLHDVQIRQIREGYMIDLPAAEPIQS